MKFPPLRHLTTRAGVSDTRIDEAELVLGVRFPAEYRAFLIESDGIEGRVGNDGYLHLWSLDEVLKIHAIGEAAEIAPGLVLVGSDGGSESFGFVSTGNSVSFVQVSGAALYPDDLEPLGNTFGEMLQRIEDGVP